jgi:NMD protein affecting ribosome stability and mRNA decay
MKTTRILCGDCGTEIDVAVVHLPQEETLRFCTACGSEDLEVDHEEE